nr:MAG TPA: hypothetical protein [Caudoviricetes sp.]
MFWVIKVQTIRIKHKIIQEVVINRLLQNRLLKQNSLGDLKRLMIRKVKKP